MLIDINDILSDLDDVKTKTPEEMAEFMDDFETVKQYLSTKFNFTVSSDMSPEELCAVLKVVVGEYFSTKNEHETTIAPYFKPAAELSAQEKSYIVSTHYNSINFMKERYDAKGYKRDMERAKKGTLSEKRIKTFQESYKKKKLPKGEFSSKLINDPNYILIRISKKEFFERYDDVLKTCKTMLSSGKDIDVILYQDLKEQSNKEKTNYVYTKEEFDKIIDFNNTLRSCGLKRNIKINEFSSKDWENGKKYNFVDDAWDLEAVKKANEEVDKIVKIIKDKNLSPYEAMIFIHNYITSSFKYNSNSVRNHEATFIGAYNGGAIVCSGYSSLTKAIIDKLGYKDLSCEFLSVQYYHKYKDEKYFPGGAHSQCLIHIKDDKYGIKGSYVNDACADAKTDKFPTGKGFANFLIPVEDVMHYNGSTYHQEFIENRSENIDKTSMGFSSLIGYEIIPDGYQPAVVRRHHGESKPIPVSTFKKGFSNMSYKLYPERTPDEIETVVERKIKDTTKIARKIYKSSATNAFSKLAEESGGKRRASGNLLGLLERG